MYKLSEIRLRLAIDRELDALLAGPSAWPPLPLAEVWNPAPTTAAAATVASVDDVSKGKLPAAAAAAGFWSLE